MISTFINRLAFAVSKPMEKVLDFFEVWGESRRQARRRREALRRRPGPARPSC